MSNKPTKRSSTCTPTTSILEQADAALRSLLIVYEDGDDEPGDIAKISEHIHSLLQNANDEAIKMQQRNDLLIQIIQTVKAQRDEAIDERDILKMAEKVAIFQGILLVEEARLNTDWTSFGIDASFSLEWLVEVMERAGDTHTANAIALFQTSLLASRNEAEAFLRGLKAPDAESDDSLPF